MTPMTSARGRVVTAFAGVSAAVAGLVFLLLPNGEADPSNGAVQQGADPRGHGGTAEPRTPGGVRPRPVDPANYIAAEQTTDPSRRAEFMLEADRSEDLVAAVKAGETHWLPTLIDMDFSDVAFETYLQCSSSHLRQPCRYDVDYVIEVKEPGVGQVMFGRVVMDNIYEKDCEQYVKCMVKGAVGASVVVSPEVSGTFSRRKSQTDNYADVTLDQLKEMLALMEEGVAMMEGRGPDGELDWEYRLELERSIIILLKMRIAAMAG
jgi:hypothetical protein